MTTDIITKPRCFLIENSDKHDITSVPQYGDIKVLLPNARSGAAWDKEYCAGLIAACEEELFDPQHDYIVCAGPNMAIFIGAATIARRYGPLQVLFWDGFKKRFDIHVIDLGES